MLLDCLPLVLLVIIILEIILERTVENDIIPSDSLIIMKRSLQALTKKVYSSKDFINQNVITDQIMLDLEFENYTRILLEILKLTLISDDTSLFKYSQFLLCEFDSCIKSPDFKSKLHIYDQNQLMKVNDSQMSLISTVILIYK